MTTVLNLSIRQWRSRFFFILLTVGLKGGQNQGAKRVGGTGDNVKYYDLFFFFLLVK